MSVDDDIKGQQEQEASTRTLQGEQEQGPPRQATRVQGQAVPGDPRQDQEDPPPAREGDLMSLHPETDLHPLVVLPGERSERLEARELREETHTDRRDHPRVPLSGERLDEAHHRFRDYAVVDTFSLEQAREFKLAASMLADGKFQNIRCPRVFKTKDGAYDINGRGFRAPARVYGQRGPGDCKEGD